MNESEPLIYDSEFLPNVQIAIVVDEHPQYKDLKPLFDEYGYGFIVPGKNLIIIDGEQFIDNFNSDVLKFVEAMKCLTLLWVMTDQEVMKMNWMQI